MDLKQTMEGLLRVMVEKKGSDLFITAGWPPSIKVDGVLYPAIKQALTAEETREMVYLLMNERQKEEFIRTNECQFAIDRPKIGRFRVSALVQRDAAAMVLRRIETKIPTLEELILPSILRTLAMTNRGMVIFVGGTGTGKSTSLAALVGYRNRHSTGHIVTIEDPIEYVHEHDGCIITQREVGVDTASFEVALKNTLRQAPDVILIGEIRTRQTMEYAIAFAETGHLVLATLHANNANQALDRIINFFPEDAHAQLFMDLSLNLKAVVAQQLIPRKSGQGRRAVVEILLNTPLAADMIRKREIHKIKELMKKSREQGMITFDQALFDLYNEGEITFEDALQRADSANEVRLMIKLRGGGVQHEAMELAIEKISLVGEEEDDGGPLRLEK
jgi:twitching motility protein PilU